jgi:glycosyltransferase involved in cell wall biosynthesis
MSNNYKIIVPLYNVEEWIDKCVKSIKLQDYENYECYLIDDISTDSTGDIIKNLIEGDNRFHYIRNTEKKYALRNIYEAVELSGNDSEDIIVTLDGDDWFATKKCLSTLNEKYDSTGCHITYGSYIEYPSMAKGPFCREIPSEIVKNQSYRKHRWVSSHLRTFKRHLWNRIEKHDLLDQDGNFYQMTWDMAFMFPMLEMAGPLSLHIPEILYSYNRQNPLNDDKVNHALQLATENTIRNKNVYKQGFVTCNILGPSGDMSGIGNQLFCVATTLSYALDNDCTPFFLQMGSDNHIKKYKNNFYKNLPIGSHDVSHSIYAEKNFHYDAIPEGQNNLKMHGYFQSEKYFNNNREKIISLLNAPALKEQATQKYGDYSNHISIHVRRGDYLELSDFHHNLSIDYYKNAIDKFDKNSKYLVFSNDIEWCKDNFDFIENVEFSTCEEDWEDIVLMSNCQHNIIANSSFSWWGAWLNENPNKKVICPSKWFGPKFSNKDTKDLLSPSWTII